MCMHLNKTFFRSVKEADDTKWVESSNFGAKWLVETHQQWHLES